jgi:hypothetical protein
MDMMRGGAHQCYGAVHARAVQDVGIGGLQVGTQRWPFSLGHLGAYVLHTSCPLHIGDQQPARPARPDFPCMLPAADRNTCLDVCIE